MSEALRDLRRIMLRTWDPCYLPLPEKEAASLRKLWAELRAVESVDAWKSISALSGQIVEALLRHKLLAGGHYGFRTLSTQTLSPLIEMARKAGLLPGYDDPTTGADSISTALVFRNWASHASLWHDYPTELRATQSIALTICTLESLLPKEERVYANPPEQPTEAWWDEQWAHTHPVTLLAYLEANPNCSLCEYFRNDPARLYVHVLRYGAPRTVDKLLELVHLWHFNEDVLRACLTEHFVDLVRNSVRGSFRYLVEVIWRLRLMKMDAHASTFSILLPFEGRLLARLIRERSPAWVARYVGECARAEPQVFASMAAKSAQLIVEAFWSKFGAEAGNIINMANILGTMPVQVRIAILDRAPSDHLIFWVEASAPRDSVNLLRSLNDRAVKSASHLVPLKERVASALRRTIRASSPSELHEIPLRLKRFKIEEQPIAVATLREVLEVALKPPKEESEWDSIRRIVWDVYAFYPELASEALAGATEILARTSERVPFWTQLCLAGLLDVAGVQRQGLSQEQFDENEFLSRLNNRSVDRWQCFAAAVAYDIECRRNSVEFPVAAVKMLASRYSETKRPEGGSGRLYDAVADVLKTHADRAKIRTQG